MTPLAGLLAYFLIFIPVIIGPGSDLGFEQSKVLAFILLAGITVLLNIRAIKLKPTPIFKLSLILVGLLFVSTVFSVSPWLSWYGQAPYYQGFALYFCLWLSYLVWKNVKLSSRFLLGTLAACCLIITLLALKDFIMLNYLNYQILNYAGRVVSTFGQPNFFAGFLVICLPLFLFANQWRRLGLIVAPITLFGIILSESRAALVIAVIIVSIWLTYQLKQRLRRVVWGVGLTTIAVSLVCSHIFMSGVVWQELDYPPRPLYFLHDFPVRGFYFWQFKKSYHPEKRFYIWPVVGELALNRPITGYGLETLSSTFTTANLAQYHGLQVLSINSAHNYLLDLWYSGGVFVLSCWIGLFILALRNHHQLGWRLSLIAYFLLIMVQNQSVVHLAFFWMLVGLADRGEHQLVL